VVTSLILASAFVPAAGAAGLGGLAIYGGIFNTDGDESPIELGLEYRFDGIKLPKLPASAALRPAIGVAGTEEDNYWIYGGLRLDLKLLGWTVTPQFAVTLYEEGDGKDLGGVLQFRSGFEVSFRFAAGPRLGLLFYHLSNANLYDRNPGSNSLVVTLSLGR
jgi:hypothetical protein